MIWRECVWPPVEESHGLSRLTFLHCKFCLLRINSCAYDAFLMGSLLNPLLPHNYLNVLVHESSTIIVILFWAYSQQSSCMVIATIVKNMRYLFNKFTQCIVYKVSCSSLFTHAISAWLLLYLRLSYCSNARNVSSGGGHQMRQRDLLPHQHDHSPRIMNSTDQTTHEH